MAKADFRSSFDICSRDQTSDEQVEDLTSDVLPLDAQADSPRVGAANFGVELIQQYEQGNLPDDKKVAAAVKARDAAAIRRVLFAGIISSLLLLVALAIRDFIAGTVEDFFPEGGFKNRLMVLVIVVVISMFLVLLIYEAELDL